MEQQPERVVLLVEDNPMNQKVASAMLRRQGCEVDVANHGLEALEHLARRAYTVVFMDCQMPQLDGFETTRRIRDQEGETGAHIPIVALTANAMPGDRARCMDAGMDDYLTKPILPDVLREALSRWAPAAS